jgi:succinate dehydrogenase / fumarate reductase cytochrome b subunit
VQQIKERPISPHLTIYKQGITGSFSILHRITGAITFGSLLVFCWAMSFLSFVGFENTKSVFCGCNIMKICLFFISYSFFYHLLNGARHLIWDTGSLINIKAVKITAFIVVVLSLSLNFYFWSDLI